MGGNAPHDQRHEPFVEIYSRLDQGERLVATIEVLSLSNKTPGEQGRDLYPRKQREVLAGRAHLVEIDLLRGGQHTTAVPRDRAWSEAGPFDYHACIHHFDHWEDFQVYPIRLEEKLPVLSVPLLPGDGEVPLDLQAVFDPGQTHQNLRSPQGNPKIFLTRSLDPANYRAKNGGNKNFGGVL